MSDATYYRGLTVEFDEALPRLTIEGQKIAVQKDADANQFSCDQTSYKTTTLLDLGKWIVDHSALSNKRDLAKQQHLAILREGVPRWNEWRQENPEIRPMLFECDLTRPALGGIGLSRANFANTVLINAKLRAQELQGANFHEANLGGADMTDALLICANFCRADLYGTVLHGADLTNANLQGAQLAKTNLKDATLTGCKVYGSSAWDLQLEGAKQNELVVRYRFTGVEPGTNAAENELVVEDLQVAQFLYLLLNNARVRDAIDTLGKKVVLILGRFTPERKRVLNGLRDALRAQQYVPIIFDFERPTQRDLTETVRILAGLSRFVIVDITSPSSTGLELQATVPVFKIPYVPILERGHKKLSMLQSIQGEDHVLPLLYYANLESLIRQLDEKIVQPALALGDQIVLRKAQKPQVRH